MSSWRGRWPNIAVVCRRAWDAVSDGCSSITAAEQVALLPNVPVGDLYAIGFDITD